MSQSVQTTINQRLSILVDEFEGGSKAVFASKIGVTVQSVHDLIGGRKGMPSFKVVSSILEQYPTVDANWLVIGQGQMLRSQVPTLAPQANELEQLAHEYIQVSKQLEGIKATVRELSSNRTLLKEDVDHARQSLEVIKEHQPSFNQDGQNTVKELIEQYQQILAKAQERYNNFTPILDQAETELINMLNHQGKLEVRINSIVSPD